MHWFVITGEPLGGREPPLTRNLIMFFVPCYVSSTILLGSAWIHIAGVRPPRPDRSSVRYFCIATFKQAHCAMKHISLDVYLHTLDVNFHKGFSDLLRSVMWEDLDVGLKRCSAPPGCCSISFILWYNVHSRFPGRPTHVECLYIGWVPGAWIRPIATTVEGILWRLLSTCVDVNMPWNRMSYFKKCDFVWYDQKLFWLEWFLTFLYYVSQTISHTDWILPAFHHRYAIPLLLHHKNSMSKLVGRQQGEDAFIAQ